MPYKIAIKGITIECETADEVVEIANRLSGTDVARARTSNDTPPANSRWTETRVSELLRAISPAQRKLVDALAEYPEGRTDTQLCQAVGLDDNRALGGVFTGLWKNARKVGADPNDLYTKRKVNIGGTEGFEYFLTDTFRAVSERVRA